MNDFTPLYVVDATGRGASLREVWRYRDLLFLLIRRDITVVYRQAVVGVGWAIGRPLLTMVVFTAVFGGLARIPSDGIPYAVFSFSGLLPWACFSGTLLGGVTGLVGSAGLITKVYFPRVLVPLAAAGSPLLDLVWSSLVLLALMGWFAIVPTWKMLLLPLFVLHAILAALSISLWLSAVNIRYRDVGLLVPHLMQVAMYVSPVAYPSSLVPERFRTLYSMNPMAGVIDGFRWALLGTPAPPLLGSCVGLTITLTLLVGGLSYFRRVEDTLADVA